jgi:hypothetical protein
MNGRHTRQKRTSHTCVTCCRSSIPRICFTHDAALHVRDIRVANAKVRQFSTHRPTAHQLPATIFISGDIRLKLHQNLIRISLYIIYLTNPVMITDMPAILYQWDQALVLTGLLKLIGQLLACSMKRIRQEYNGWHVWRVGNNFTCDLHCRLLYKCTTGF